MQYLAHAHFLAAEARSKSKQGDTTQGSGGSDPAMHYNDCIAWLLRATRFAPHKHDLWFNLAFAQGQAAVATLRGANATGQTLQQRLREVRVAVERLKRANATFAWLVMRRTSRGQGKQAPFALPRHLVKVGQAPYTVSAEANKDTERRQKRKELEQQKMREREEKEEEKKEQKALAHQKMQEKATARMQKSKNAAEKWRPSTQRWRRRAKNARRSRRRRRRQRTRVRRHCWFRLRLVILVIIGRLR